MLAPASILENKEVKVKNLHGNCKNWMGEKLFQIAEEYLVVIQAENINKTLQVAINRCFFVAGLLDLWPNNSDKETTLTIKDKIR